MGTYIATERGGRERSIRCRGDTIEEVAQHAVNRLVGRSAEVHRCTGERGEPGVFQGYQALPRRYGGGMTSVGENIHIRQVQGQ